MIHMYIHTHSLTHTHIYILLQILFYYSLLQGFPDGTSGKESACKTGDIPDLDLISGSGRSPGEGNGNTLQYSCLENPMNRGAWRATVHGVTESQTRPEHLSTHLGYYKILSMVPFAIQPAVLFPLLSSRPCCSFHIQ